MNSKCCNFITTKNRLLLGLLLTVVMTSMPLVFGDTTGNTPPTIAASSPGSISEFINENNAFVSDNNRATGFINFDQAYGAFGFDISIPDGSTINGITVNLEGRRTIGCGLITGSPQFSVRLSDPLLIGPPTGFGSFTGITNTTTNFGTSDSVKILGSATTTWGNTYPNLDNFWILVTAKCGLLITAMQLDQVTVDVDYTLPAVKQGSSCTNCQDPSIGVTNRGQRVVDDGITINGQTSDANYYFTPFPLVKVQMNEPVRMQFVIWDDRKDNIGYVALELGKVKIGESFGTQDSKLVWTRNVMTKETSVDYDQTSFADVTMKMLGKTSCLKASHDFECDFFEIQFTPIQAVVGDVVFGIEIRDDNRNAMTSFFNEGLQVGTEADVIPIVEFVAPQGTGNKSTQPETIAEDCSSRNTECFKSRMLYEQVKATMPKTIQVYLSDSLSMNDSIETNSQ